MMDIFGIVIGQNIISVLIGGLIAGLGFFLLKWGWGWKIIGVLLFSGSTGWLTSIILTRDLLSGDREQIPVYATFAAASFAAWVAWEKRETVRVKSQRGGFSGPSHKTVIGALVLAIVGITTFTYFVSNGVGMLDFNDRRVQKAYDRSSDGTLRYINKFLRAVDRQLAK